MSCTTGGALERRVGTSITGMAGGDSAGVVFCSMLLGTNSTRWLIDLAESGMVAIFLAVAALGIGFPGKVFLYMAEAIANGKGGGPEVFMVDCSDQGDDDCGCCFVEAALSWD
jgi:hypothetical protein